MTRKEREMKRRRQEIIDAAEELFLTKGFAEVSMSEIAKKAEFTRPTLYAYFKNKEDLYTIVFLKHSRIRWAVLDEAMAEKNTGYDKLYAFGDAYYQYAEQYPEYMRFMLYIDHYGLDFEKISPEINEEFYTPRDQSLAHLTGAFQLGVEDGTLREDININHSLTYLCMTLRTILNEVVVLKYYPKEFYYEYLNLFLRAIKNHS